MTVQRLVWREGYAVASLAYSRVGLTQVPSSAESQRNSV